VADTVEKKKTKEGKWPTRTINPFGEPVWFFETEKAERAE
jgi:hypothetical protein